MKEKLSSIKTKIILGSVTMTILGFAIFACLDIGIVKKKITELYVDKAIDIATQIGEQFELMMEYDISNDEMQKHIVDVVEKNDNIAYAVVIDKSVTAVLHSDKEKIGKNYSDDLYTVDGCTNGTIKTSEFFADVQRVMTYDIMVPIYVDGELYGAMDVGIYEGHINAIIKNIVKVSIGSVLGIGFITIILMTVICELLFRAFNELIKLCKQMGEGDFTTQIDPRLLKVKGEIGTIVQVMNHMRDTLRDMMYKTSGISNDIVELSKQINEKTNATNDIAIDITSAINDVMSGSEEQSNLTEETSNMMEQINQGMDEVANSMQNVSSASGATVENAKEGYTLVNNVVKQMDTIQQLVNITADKIQILSQNTDKIENVVNFINEIASQTNLLALNASIEAARAGEQGKGFAVVADEVGTLAEQSAKAASEIVELIREVQMSTKDSIMSMEGSRKSIEEGTTLAKEAGAGFETILQEIQKVSEDFTNISAITEEVTASSSNLMNAIGNISEITQSTNEKTNHVVDAVEQQNIYMKDVLQVVSQLKDISNQLDENMKGFKL